MNWGIIGTGGIAGIMAKDYKMVSNGKIVGVVGTSPKKAQDFAKKYNLDKAYESVDKLLSDETIDIVYIATPHPTHKDIAIKAMKAGKAVLCEKPMAINAIEEEEMIQVAKEENVFLMEAVWSRYLPAIKEMLKWIESGEIGNVKHIKADFSFRGGMDLNTRLYNPNLGGGALLDTGIYVIYIALLIGRACKAGNIKNMYTSVQLLETGVDGQDSILIEFDSGLSASLSCGVTLECDKALYVYGEEGHIEVPEFFMAKKASLYKNGDHTDYKNNIEARGYMYEAMAVNDLVKDGMKESPLLPLELSLEAIRIIDKIRYEAGIKYPSEV